MRFLVITILALFLITSCKKEPTQPEQKPAQQTLRLSDSLATDSTVSPSKALDLSNHGHGNVPKIAEKAHQNPVKQGKMQSKIRRGTSKKRRAMQSTMNKKSQHLKDQQQQ